jgi:putative flippase GtrA
MVRFAPAALAALTATAVVYFVCGSVWHLTGRVTGAAGWLAGAVVSYGVSRWAWERRGRPPVLREMVPFVAVSVAAGAVLIEASHLGYQAAAALGLHGLAFYAFAEGCYLAANCVTFVARFVIFNFVVFADGAVGWAGLYARHRTVIVECARFGVVGLAGLVVTAGGANLLRYQAGLGRISAVAVATVAATGVTFAGSRYWTYRHRERTGLGREAALFFAVNGVGVAISAVPVGLTYPLHLNDGLSYNVALGVGIVLGTFFRYWAYRAWVWRAGAVASTVPAARMPAWRDLSQVRPARVLPAGARAVLAELVRFGVVGAFAVLVSGAAVGLLAVQAGVRPLASAAAAALLATAVSFAGNRYWTFRHRRRATVGRDGGRYVMLSAAGLVIQAACVQLAARLLGLPGALALGLGLSFGLRFWLCRAWVWRAPWPGSSVIA